MSDFFDEEEAEAEDRPVTRRRRPRLVFAATLVVLLIVAFSIFTSIWTQKLWFDSLGESRVYGTLLGTKVALFCVFGLLMALLVGINMVIAYRIRPILRQRTPEQAGLERYRDIVGPMQRILVVVISVIVGLFAGGSAVGEWRNYLMWSNRQPFHRQDPWFHKDIGFYVFSLPWFHYLVDFAMTGLIVALVATLVTHYLYGGIRLQSPGDRFGRAAQRHVCVLLGLLVLFKGLAYYLDRFDLTSRNGSLITGMTYARQHAVLPSQNVLMVIAAICALLFFASVWRGSWMLPGMGVALFAFTAVLLGLIWPAVVQRFQVSPNVVDKERTYIAANIAATRAGYGLEHVTTVDDPGNTKMTTSSVADAAPLLNGIRLLDPAIAATAFENEQKLSPYYGVPGVLDLDRYPLGEQERELDVAVRDLDLTGLAAKQRTWANEHTVYTHGYGVIAAYSNQRGADDQPDATGATGLPDWAEKDIPPTGVLGTYEPRIYYGETSPSYSIVGHAAGAKNVELDTPGTAASGPTKNVYTGPGVSLGSTFHRLLYAVKFGDFNIAFSSRVNADSKILYDRSPAQRVAKVAPWLTLDSDSYPTVVGGRVLWVVDGYTTSNRFAGSAKQSMSDMTSDATEPRSTFASLPNDQINYIRNSVKATVDAATGQVTLYAWNQTADPDPILQAMEQAFPGLVQQTVPADLLPHLRYPDDLFKVQRYVLGAYHVSDPATFYNESQHWEVPNDPSSDSRRQPPYRLSVAASDGTDPVPSIGSLYSLSLKQTLSAFVSVDSDATSADYGKLEIRQFPSDTTLPGPDQAATAFSADRAVAAKIDTLRTAGQKVTFGELTAQPVGDALLYVQPIYAVKGKQSPRLTMIAASFGNKTAKGTSLVGMGTTLPAAIADALSPDESSEPSSPSGSGSTTSPGSSTPPTTLTPTLQQLIDRADQHFAAAKKALKAGDLVTWFKENQAGTTLVDKEVAEAATATKGGKAGGS